MHFAFFAPPLAGHLNPLATLARELAARRHRCTFVQPDDSAPLLDRRGWERVTVEGWAAEGRAGTRRTIRGVALQTDLLCRLAPEALRRIGAEAVIADQLEPAGGLVARRLRLPFATVASALPMNREPGVPPPYVGWRFDPTPRGLWRNRGGWRVTDLLMRPVGRVIGKWSAAWGLGPRGALEDCFSPLLQLAQALPSIDFPRAELPPHFHYLGPFREPPTEPFDLPPSGGRRRVYCTLGTLQGGRERLFRAVAAAAADLDLDLVIAHGGRLSPAAAARLPGTPHVFDFVPQQQVMAGADLVVTHGGFNTVLDSLAAGLPIAAMPLAYEQPAIAARIEQAGVGAKVRPALAGRRTLRSAMERLLGEPGYRERARSAAAEVAASGGVSRAADLVEAAMGVA